jgi:hypothetical protein
VATRRGLWKLEQGKIAYLGEKPPAKATLELKLRDRASGEPREGQIMLCRIDAPAEPGWTGGDLRIGEYNVDAGGLTIPDLAPGKYRATCEIHARSAAELPVFELRAPATQIVLDVEPPLEREVLVEIFDVHGQPFENAESLPSSRASRLRLPDWLKLRSKIEPDGTVSSEGVGGFEYIRSAHQAWAKLKRGAHGFSLGREREDGGIQETSRSIMLRVPDHGIVDCTLRFGGHEELRYRILLVERASLAGLFTLPEGGPVDLARLQVDTPLEPDAQPRPDQWWLDVPIAVSVSAPGCKPVELKFRLRDGLPRARRLEKAP